MDRRITKTKKALKEALISLLDRSSFEDIKVKDICGKADISRNTYYVYYSDKYGLLDEIMKEAGAYAGRVLDDLQNKNNPGDDPVRGYSNLLSAIMDMFSAYSGLFKHMDHDNNPYMYFSSHMYIFNSIRDFAVRYEKVIKPRYPTRRTVMFLCNGLLSFIQESFLEGIDEKTVREESENILRDFLNSDYFTYPKEN